MLSTHRAGKGGGWGGWGLGSADQKWPLVSEGGQPHLGAQKASWARVGGANTLHSSPAPPVLESPSCKPPGLPPMSPGPTQPVVGFGGWGSAWELSRLPGPEWVGQTPPTPLLLLPSWSVPTTCLSCSPRPPSYAPRTHSAWSGLWRVGDRPGSLGPQWVEQTPSTPLPLLWSWRPPPACLSCSLPDSFLCPQD